MVGRFSEQRPGTLVRAFPPRMLLLLVIGRDSRDAMAGGGDRCDVAVVDHRGRLHLVGSRGFCGGT